MQRVVRLSLAGVLAIAGASLAACGDKVTIPPQQVTPPDTVVHGVTVSPAAASVAVGGTIQLAASVDAGAGVSVRTVTWTSSDATTATVDATGKVTGVKVGTATIIAKSAKDPNVSGAAAVTVTGGPGAVTVTISSINQTICGVGGCNSVPANLANVAGQIDVILNVEANGQQLKSVQATLTCGSKSLSAQQTISNLAPVAAEAAAVPVTLSFNTAQFNATTGVPALLNGNCTIAANATTAAGTQSATNNQQLTLANIDGVVLTSAMSGASANDVNGLPWKTGSLTVSALPVLYSGRTPATITITVPGSTNPSQTIAASTTGATTATWSGTATSGSRITGLTIIGSYDANGFPQGIHPSVLVIDNNGVDLSLGQLNATSQSDVRIDNTAPAAPTVFTIPNSPPAGAATGQNGWVNAAFVFTGAAGKYVTGGDIGVSNGVGTGAPGPINGAPTVSPTAGISGTTGLVSTSGMTYTYFAAQVTSYTNVGGAAAPTTGTGATNCATTGLTPITTAGDLAATLVNTTYRVRVSETDKLGNVRCADLGGTVGAGQNTFGVDKVAPTASFNDPTSAQNLQAVNIANPGIPSWSLTISDDASGFTATPVQTLITRNFPAIGTAAKCIVPSILNSSNVCIAQPAAATMPITGNGAPATEGYYTYSATVQDQAQNSAPVLARQAIVDVTAPIMGGVSVPASLIGGASASFATSATDNLDLNSSNFTLQYATDLPTPPAGSTGLKFRQAGPTLGTAFSGTLTTAASFSATVTQFLRNVQLTTAAGAPTVAYGVGNLPNNIFVRVVDAAGNPSATVATPIAAANVVQTNPVPFSYSTLAASFTGWTIGNTAADNVCIIVAPATACAAPAQPTSVTLKAQATGVLSTFQLPFQQVQFYYFDTGYAAATNEWIFIASTGASSVTDIGAPTNTRTFTWTTGFTPPKALGTGVKLNVIAIGMNATGDALATPNNALINLVP